MFLFSTLAFIFTACNAAAFSVNITSATLSLEVIKRASTSPYIFTAFTSSSESNLYIYTSADGTDFSLLKGPAYSPTSSLIRDPSLTLHSDGRYYIAYTTGWTGRNFAIASSDDLQTWELTTTVSTVSASFTPVNTWAPEFFRDPNTRSLNVIVSLSTSNNGPFLPYILTATDETLQTWSSPVLMAGVPGRGLGYIDTFPVFFKNEYHIFAKAESEGEKFVEHAVSSTLAGPYTFVQTGDFAEWGRVEGPCITILPNGIFRLYADGFDSGKSIYSDSADLFKWSKFKIIPGLSGFVRHGTVVRQASFDFKGTPKETPTTPKETKTGEKGLASGFPTKRVQAEPSDKPTNEVSGVRGPPSSRAVHCAVLSSCIFFVLNTMT